MTSLIYSKICIEYEVFNIAELANKLWDMTLRAGFIQQRQGLLD
jgi:hypothetical protein